MAQLLDYLSEKYQPDSIDEVNRRLLELSSLFEIGQLLNESLELSRVLNNVLFIPMGRLMIPRGAIILKLRGEYKVAMAKGISEELKSRTFPPDSIPQECFTVQKFSPDNGQEKTSGIYEFARDARLEISIPFMYNNQPLGLMLFGPKLTKHDFSKEETDFLLSLANLSATTIENALQLEEIKQINRQLDERIQELKTLFDIGQGLSSTLDYSKILKLLVYALMGQMLITKYAIVLKNDSHFSIHENKGFNEDFVESLYARLHKKSQPQATVAARNLPDETSVKLCEKHGVQAIIPMQHQEKLIGYILLGAKISGQAFSETDLEFLTTLVSQAVISLENARLFEETLEKQRLEEELNVARTIQKNLLPKTIPQIEGYEIYGMNNSSKQVGGDYYDVIPIDKDRIALAIGDVSGKGIPASLLMANLQSALRVMMTPDVNLTEVVGKLNNLIYSNTGLDKFITFFIGVLNTRSHILEYVNAGHNNPVLCSPQAEISFLDIGGIILGIMPGYAYKIGKVSLKKGDFILTYTDGVNEAINPREEEFGEEQLYELLKSHTDKPVKQIAENIWQAIEKFAGGYPQADDVTMLAVRRL
jgi:sigma-B regulation protein RsbU (phosphoserine phosphatase)